jgi:hypothetical protein
MKFLNTNLLALIAFPIIIFLLFGLSIYGLISGVVGAVIIYFLYSKLGSEKKSELGLDAILIIIGAVALYLSTIDIQFVSSFLIGINLAFYYFQVQSGNLKRSLNLLNVIILAGIVFNSGITKFRGFNKIDSDTVMLTIPILLLITLALYFLLISIEANSKTARTSLKPKIITIVTLLLPLILWGFTYWLFKEIGTETILFPLLCGLAVGVIELFIKPKSILTDINEIILLTLLPYRISGLMGIALAFLLAYLYITIMRRSMDITYERIESVVYKLTPLMFLIAATEIRENEGQIIRFNLINGNQAGWIFLAIALIYESAKYRNKLKEILEKNEVGSFLPLLYGIFTILALVLIIRFGNDESLAALIFGTSIYLYLVGLIDSKKYEDQLMFVSSLGAVIGATAFLVLTRVQ